VSDTPRTNQAITNVVDAGGTLSLEHKPLVALCRALEAEVRDLRAELAKWQVDTYGRGEA